MHEGERWCWKNRDGCRNSEISKNVEVAEDNEGGVEVVGWKDRDWRGRSHEKGLETIEQRKEVVVGATGEQINEVE
ncbi:hypothetical protein VNO77_23269 [Canavalia gladiata]|uniref:Uncharacterized protein n=1 Tax=Canavalia gladiata TaxID=3824 RepID=A0AAN9L9D5_CANGL